MTQEDYSLFERLDKVIERLTKSSYPDFEGYLDHLRWRRGLQYDCDCCKLNWVYLRNDIETIEQRLQEWEKNDLQK